MLVRFGFSVFEGFCTGAVHTYILPSPTHSLIFRQHTHFPLSHKMHSHPFGVPLVRTGGTPKGWLWWNVHVDGLILHCYRIHVLGYSGCTQCLLLLFNIISYHGHCIVILFNPWMIYKKEICTNIECCRRNAPRNNSTRLFCMLTQYSKNQLSWKCLNNNNHMDVSVQL